MTVYAVVQLSIHDRRRYERYASRFTGLLAGTGGRLLAADTSPEVRSGEWPHDSLVLLQFPDHTGFERWARSPEFVAISTDRIGATTSSVVRVTGVATMPPGHADLAERVATEGPATKERELRRFIRDARRWKATPLLLAILADPSQPEVARQRAFGELHAELEQRRRSASPTVQSGHDAA